MKLTYSQYFRFGISALIVGNVLLFSVASDAANVSPDDLFLPPSLITNGFYDTHILTVGSGTNVIQTYTSNDMGGTLLSVRILPVLNPNPAPTSSEGEYTPDDLANINVTNYSEFFYLQPGTDYLADVTPETITVDYRASGQYFVEIRAATNGVQFTHIYLDQVDDFFVGEAEAFPGRVYPRKDCNLYLVSQDPTDNGAMTNAYDTLQAAGKHPQWVTNITATVNAISNAFVLNNNYRVEVSLDAHGVAPYTNNNGHVSGRGLAIGNQVVSTNAGSDMTPKDFQKKLDGWVHSIHFYSCELAQDTNFMYAIASSIGDVYGWTNILTSAGPENGKPGYHDVPAGSLEVHYENDYVWNGSSSPSWDTTSPNWTLCGTPVNYSQGDAVRFDDTAVASSVNLTTTLCPGGVTVSNNAHPYTFSGLGGFSGGMSLTKQGSSTLIIANTGTNEFSGGMTIWSGTVQIGPGGSSSINYGPIVNYSSLVVTATNPITIVDLITGRGSLTKNSPGILLLLATNSYTGSTYINSGTLALGTNASISISGIISVNGNAKFDVSSVSNYTLYGGQTLQGSGTVTGNMAAASGAALSPGGPGAIGTLSFSNNLSLSAGVTNYFELAPTPGTGNDLIQVAGDLQPDGATIAITATGALSTNGSYRLFNYGGSKTNSFNGAVSLTRYTLTLNESAAHQINLIVSGSGADLVWAGDGSSNCWDVCNSANFNDNSEPFHQADAVTFDDTSMNSPVNLVGTLYPASVTVNSASDYVFQGAGKISGTTGLTKTGAGTLTICKPNDYKGPTLILGGSLSLSQPDGVLNGSTNISVSAGAMFWATGRADQTLKLANGQTLSGNGMVVAPNVVVGAGATVAPGSNTVGHLTFSGNLTFQSGSTAAMELNKAAGINDQIVGVTSLIYGGTLRITNISAAPLAAGDSFKLFDAENYLGTFAGIVPATPGSGLRWNTTALAGSGTLTVAAAPQPCISSVTLWSGTNLVICGTNGTSGMPCYVLTSTNVAAPLTNWTVLATNSFGTGGSFSFTNTVTPVVPQRFYRLQAQ